jgi:DNA-binding transcriptional MerR regulator
MYDIPVLTERPGQLTLDALARRTGLHPDLIERFVEFGLILPVERRSTTVLFDAATVARVRVICRLRESLGINLAGISVILDLLDRMRAVQQERDWLRNRR